MSLARFQVHIPTEPIRINQEGVLKQSGFCCFFHPIELKFIQFVAEGFNFKITKSFFCMTRLRCCFLFLHETTLSTECTVCSSFLQARQCRPAAASLVLPVLPVCVTVEISGAFIRKREDSIEMPEEMESEMESEMEEAEAGFTATE